MQRLHRLHQHAQLHAPILRLAPRALGVALRSACLGALGRQRALRSLGAALQLRLRLRQLGLFAGVCAASKPLANAVKNM
jgi:hypothetical protein